jgi:hypothetical protein
MSLMPFALSAALLLAGAQKSGATKQVSAGREFSLKMGQRARLRDGRLTVRFASVAEDSRCPAKVDCVWAGNAKVSLVVQSPGGRATTVELNTNSEPKTGSSSGYEISLKRLDPHPQSGTKINQKDYAATLILRRK